MQLFSKSVMVCFVFCSLSITAALPDFHEVTIPGTVPSGGDNGLGRVAYGDLDGDLDNDIVVHAWGGMRGLDQSLGGVFWYEYPSWTQHTIDDSPAEDVFGDTVLCVDLDRDGDMDIVTSKGDESTVQKDIWYENLDGSGTNWQEHLINTSSFNPDKETKTLEVADMDRDGRLDVVSRREYRVYVCYQEAGTNNWTIQSQAGLHDRENMGLGDVDQDGYIDILLNGWWLRNDGTRTVSGWSSYDFDSAWYSQNNSTWSDNAIKVHAADLNEDGMTDIVVSHSEQTGWGVYWYERTNGWASGDSAWKRHTIKYDMPYSHTLQVHDMNHDGHDDVIAGVNDGGGIKTGPAAGTKAEQVYCWLNDGTGTNWTEVTISTNRWVYSGHAGDIGTDGKVDFFSTENWQSGPLYLWTNSIPSTGSLTNWNRHLLDDTLTDSPLFVYGVDLDGDGDKDIAAGAKWYENPGEIAEAWTAHTIDSGGNLIQMALAFDFDEDGDTDLFGQIGPNELDCNGYLGWAENNGSGAFTVHTNIQSGIGDFFQGIEIARFSALEGSTNGPWMIVMAWHHDSNNKLEMLIVPEDPTTGTWARVEASSYTEKEELSIADLNGDGYMDIFTGEAWLENDGSGTNFAVHSVGNFNDQDPVSTTPDPPEADRNDLVDINLDGYPDAPIGLENGTNIFWFEWNPDTTNTWTRHMIGTALGQGFSMVSGDIDRDGDVDVVVGEHRGNYVGQSNNRLLIFENNRDFANLWPMHVIDSQSVGTIDHHDGPTLVDIDDDGDLDILSIGFSNEKVWIFENTSPTDGKADPPTAEPGSGDYALFVDVMLESSAEGATIYYSLDDFVTTNIYSEPIHITNDVTIKAFAAAPDVNDSSLVSFVYDITPAGTNLLQNSSFEILRANGYPTIWADRSTSGGMYDSTTVQDGSNSLKTVYSGTPDVYSAQTVSVDDNTAYQLSGWLKTDCQGAEKIFVRTATGAVGAPWNTLRQEGVADWTYYSMIVTSSATSIRIDCLWDYDNTGSMGWFDGLYFGPAAGQSQAALPVVSPTGGVFQSSVTVTVTCSTASSTIRYTTDGSEPTTSSPVYSSPVTLVTSSTLRARAFAAGYLNSAVKEASFTVDTTGLVQAPSFTPGAGTYNNVTTVEVASATSGATNYYTLDGSAPTLTSASCTNGHKLVISTNGLTIKAFAIKDGLDSSATNSATYTLQAAGPVFDPAGGAYLNSVTVEITTATAGAEVRYTTNGTTPNGASALYSSPVVLTEDLTLKALAIKSNMADSEVTSYSYTVYGDGDGPDIDVWYGTNYSFGANGNPIRWVNIPGNVDATATSIVYTLNGGADNELNVGPCTFGRLSAQGDFNVEIPYADLSNGMNLVRIKAWKSGGIPAYRDVQVSYTNGVVWSMPYSIDWSVSTQIQDVALISDGKWAVTNGWAYTVEPGYDRAFAVGDVVWSNYEATVLVSVKSNGWELLSPSSMANVGAGSWVGMAANWQGNEDTSDTDCRSQPRNGWNKAGMLLSFYTADRYNFKVALWDGQDYMSGNTISSATTNFHPGVTNYYMKLRTTMTNSGTQCYYQGKVWPAGDAEPAAWDVETVGSAPGKTWTTGSVLFCSYECDISFGDIEIDDASTAGAPAITPAGGVFYGSVTAVLAAAQSGATNYYSTNGVVPVVSGISYTAQTSVELGSGVWTVKTASVLGGETSSVNSVVFNVQSVAAAPVMSPGAGTYAESVDVSLNSDTPAATIRYTTDGSTPTSGSPVYSSALTFTNDTLLKAYASRADLSDSTVSSVQYYITNAVEQVGGLIAYEPFDIAGADNVTIQGKSGASATGFGANVWAGHSSKVFMRHGGLAFGDLLTVSNHAEWGGGDYNSNYRILDSAITLTNGQQMWASMLMKSEASSAGVNTFCGLDFWRSGYTAYNANGALLRIGKAYKADNRWSIQFGDLEYASSSRSFANDTATNFLVVSFEVTVSGTTTNAVMSMWVNPALGAEPTGTPDACVTNLNEAFAFDRLGLGGYLAGKIDEIRLGWTWQDVMPDSSVSYTISATAGANGSILPSGNIEVQEGGSTSFVVAADTYYTIYQILTNDAALSGVQGLSSYTVELANIQATGSVYASFQEQVATAQSTPYWWLAENGLTNGGFSFDAAETNDSDGDGMAAWEEFIAGTQPTNSLSIFEIENLMYDLSDDIVITWTGRGTNRSYSVWWATNLTDAMQPLAGGKWKPGGDDDLPLSATDTVHGTAARIYYRLQVELD